MKIALFGGTFNPPHMGHIRLANAVIGEMKPDIFLLMPAGLPPHKAMPATSATNEERYEMTLLAAGDIPGAVVSRLELDRKGASYTSDTLLTLRERYPGDELILVVGGDMFLTLDQWHDAKTIFDLASIAAAPRSHAEQDTIAARAAYYEATYGARVTILKNPVVEISSSEIRTVLGKERKPHLLSRPVADYIERKGLYK